VALDEHKLQENLAEFFPDGKGLFLAYDQGFEHGPSDFSGENADPAFILKIAASGNYDAFICHKGIAEKYYQEYRDKVPLILKLNGKTSLHSDDPVSMAVASVEEAIELGATAVGYTVYVGSQHEAEMLTQFGELVHQAHEAALPVFAWMYPRGKEVPDPHDPGVIAYATRVGLEMGADVVKTYYPGSSDQLKKVVKVAGKVKVVIAGGSRQQEQSYLDEVRSILGAGAAGIAVGRNVWQADDPIKVSEDIRSVFKES
jgi:class I fructose-bisphosphate aldolase